MAVAKDLLSRFRSLSRPSLKTGSSSSAFSSYAKKQQAAEDAIIDNQYESGVLSPESYLGSLQSRTVRSTNTPLTNVNLQEKIVKVQEKVQDAKVEQGYSAGTYTTSQVLEYEKQKLAKMTAPGSAAYITQQQKVQQLNDKAQKEARADTRRAELLRISQLPDDTSATLWEKANLYQNLSEQARLDGDNQTADQLLTQANNAATSAKKADVNDIITGARLSVSETPGAGLGVPSSTDGASRLAGFGSDTQGGGVTGGTGPQSVSSGSTAVPSVTTGFSGVSNTAVKNAMKALDSGYKTYERLVQQKQDKQTLIGRYREAIAMASGDQKTQLTIQLNNLLEGDKQIDNQLAITEQGINDTVNRIQEAQQKAAASAFSQEVRKNNATATKIENELETAFAKGQITKEEYVAKGTALAEMKAQFYSQSSDVFSQYGNDSSAEAYLQKAQDMEEIHQNLVTVGTNIDSYEPIATDPGGKLTNLFGKTLQPGEIALTNVQKLKDSGDFDVNYTKDGGVYRRVYYPGQQNLVGDGFVSKAVAQELSKNATDPKSAPFVYKENKPTIGPGTGKVEAVPLVKATNGTWMTEGNYQEIKKTANDSLDEVLKKTNVTEQLIKDTKKATSTTKTTPALDSASRLFDNLFKKPQSDNNGNVITSAISNIGNGAKTLFDNAVNGAKNLLNSGKNMIAGAANNASSNIQLPSIVKKAYATYDDTTDAQVRKWAERAEAETGVSADLIIAQYKLESGSGASAPGNNYFGMKGKGTAGTQRLLTTENINGKNVKVYQNFAKYATPEDSFIAHAKLLSTDPRYKGVLEASKTGDKATVAKAIGDSPYATDPSYGAKILKLMGGVGKVYAAEPNEPPRPIAPVSEGGMGSGYNLDYDVKTNGNTTSAIAKKQNIPIAPVQETPKFIPPVSRLPVDLGPSQGSGVSSAQPVSGSSFGQTISNSVQNAINNIKPVIQQAKTYVAPKIQAVAQAAAPAVKTATNFVSNAVNSVKNAISNLFKKK